MEPGVQAARSYCFWQLVHLSEVCRATDLRGVLTFRSTEPTNEPYAAKIAGIKLCESYNRQYGTDFRSLMPTNFLGQVTIFTSMIHM